MTIKQKFSSIDQSKLTADQKAFLEKIKNVTKDFTDSEMNKKVEQPLDNFIAKAKDKMPEAIKSAPVKRTAKAKPSQTRKPKRTAMSLAKEIRKEGESWNEARARASKMMKEDSKDLSKTVESELDKLSKLVRSEKTRSKLVGISDTDIKRDAVRKAKPRGARKVTHSGETSNQYGTFSNHVGRKYYESRDRHSDRLAPRYPKNAPLLAEGGYLTDPTFGTFQNQVFAEGGDIDAFTLRMVKSNGMQPAEVLKEDANVKYNKGGAVTNERRYVNKGEDYEVRYSKPILRRKGYQGKRDFELGGVMATDLAGHTGGGDAGLNAGMPLDGFSNTGYTGLVGETGAMSSGEMFAKGGKIYDRKKDWMNYDENHLINKNNGMIVLKSTNLNEILPKDIKGFNILDNRSYENGGGLPSGVNQSYMITEAFGNPAQHFKLGGKLEGKEKQINMLFKNQGIKEAIQKEQADAIRNIIEKDGISTKGISDKEMLMIARELSKENYAKGGEVEDEIQYGSWYVKIKKDKNDEEIRNQEVARLIREGYFSGFYPSWYLKITDIEGDIDEATEQEIARLVEKGYTSGEIVMYKNNYAKGGGVRKVGNREYSYGRNWTNDFRHINKAEEHEVTYNRKGKFLGIFNYGGETYNEKASALKGGVDYYSVDIDLENGDEIRDLTFKSLDKAKKEFLKYSDSMVYDGENIDDIQLVVSFKNGDYENIYLNKGGAVTNERRYVNKGEDYEVRYSKPILRRKGYQGKRDFMAGGMNDETPRIYVADLEAYNNGRLVGEWLDLADYNDADELMDAIQDVLKKSGGEEYAIHDVEYVPRSLYSEYMGRNDFQALYEVMETAKRFDLPLEVVQEIVSQYGEGGVDEFYGKYDSAEDFAIELADDLGGLQNFSSPEYYVYITETDRRLLAQEQADTYVDDIKYEDGGNRLIEEAGLDVEEYEEADSDRQEEMLDEAREIVYDEYYDNWYEGLSDPYYFLVEEQGMYSPEDLFNDSFIRVDYERLARDLEQDYTFIEHDGDLYVFNIR